MDFKIWGAIGAFERSFVSAQIATTIGCEEYRGNDVGVTLELHAQHAHFRCVRRRRRQARQTFSCRAAQGLRSPLFFLLPKDFLWHGR